MLKSQEASQLLRPVFFFFLARDALYTLFHVAGFFFFTLHLFFQVTVSLFMLSFFLSLFV